MRKNLYKYWVVAKTSWGNSFAYPVSFWLWRLRQVVSAVVALSVWEAVFSSTATAFGYQRAEMLTYVFVANVINFIVFSSRTIDVVSIIYSGDLSLYLIRPLNFFSYWFSRDIADKLLNMFFTIGELFLLYLFFRPQLAFPQHPMFIVWTLLAIGVALVMYFFINMLLGFIGFWSPDWWSPRFLLFMVLNFTSGAFFPLDIFPQSIVRILFYSPFPYLTFFPTKIWLGHIAGSDILRGLAIGAIWCAILGTFMFAVWRKGVRGYGSEGR